MYRNFFSIGRLLGLALFAATVVLNAWSQNPGAGEADASSDKLIYLTFAVALAGLGGAYYFWRKSKTGITQADSKYKNRYRDYYNEDSYEIGDVDGDKWLRKAKKKEGKNAAANVPAVKPALNALDPRDTKQFQEKMRKLQYTQLPINSFNKLAPARDFEPLPLSTDEALLSAIEQTNEECDEDEAMRELAVRILAAFRMRNSVDALSQIALYDLSSNLRSRAVAALTDLDHETVFEAILLACADPTREVRAAAARGLFRLNFDRAGGIDPDHRDAGRVSHVPCGTGGDRGRYS